jgi:hypothetical protein
VPVGGDVHFVVGTSNALVFHQCGVVNRGPLLGVEQNGEHYQQEELEKEETGFHGHTTLYFTAKVKKKRHTHKGMRLLNISYNLNG